MMSSHIFIDPSKSSALTSGGIRFCGGSKIQNVQAMKFDERQPKKAINHWHQQALAREAIEVHRGLLASPVFGDSLRVVLYQ
jgi:hypothetical protein